MSIKLRMVYRIKHLLPVLMILVMLFIPVSVVSASDNNSVVGSVVGTYESNLQFTETSNALLINNGQFIFEMFKDTAGYDKLYYPDGTVAIYDNRFVLEYQQGAKWKQRGVPYLLSYTKFSDSIYVNRLYTDYLGTTYTVQYVFYADKPVKITITINSGQTSNYRLLWSANGITKTDYLNVTNGLKFDDITLDWNDAYLTLGNITTSSVSTAAQGRKADILFNIGTINAGETKVIDPSVVGTSTSKNAIAYPRTRKTFYAAGRHWVFYGNGTNQGFSSSVDGSTNWAAHTSIVAGSGSYLSVYFDGTYVSYVSVNANYNLLYRKGTPNSDGSITWAAAVQRIPTGSATVTYPTISVSSTGYPFVTYYVSGVSLYVTTSTTNDGTWTTDTDNGFPYSPLATTARFGDIVPLNDGDMYLLYSSNSSEDDIYGQVWDDSEKSWVDNETVTTSYSGYSNNRYGFSLASYGGIVYFVYNDGVSQEIIFKERAADGTWSDPVTIIDTDSHAYYPAISVWGTNGDLKVFWASYGGNNHIFYKSRTSGTWDINATDWIDESVDALSGTNHFSVSFTTYGRVLGIVYTTKTSTPWNVKYAFMQPLPLAPTNFIATQTGTNSITLNWDKGTYADNTVIRAKEGSYPNSITDGYEVYNGALETVNITGLTLTLDSYYYSAWSTNDAGYSVDSAKTNIGGNAMLFIGLLIACVGLTIGGFATKRPGIAFLGAGFWLANIVYCFVNYGTLWDAYYVAGFISIAGVIICIIDGAMILTHKEEKEEEEDDGLDPDIKELMKDRELMYKEISAIRGRPSRHMIRKNNKSIMG